MGDPIVHFEIIGRDAERLRRYYREMFGWEFEVGDTVADSVSAPGNYGFVDGDATGSAINGGVGGGGNYAPLTLFYVGVPNVVHALTTFPFGWAADHSGSSIIILNYQNKIRKIIPSPTV